ncbi:rhoptry neck protein ron6 [Cystoisospora suis]|uniref:Rhoptry neck protein ron6 n=1 Tax=Cystoisospora suis TaxID=483139 RepID=A0A2C6LAA6_9APIC|nr:rhoptry neck protein ron6 [Cystoisospora suis]
MATAAKGRRHLLPVFFFPLLLLLLFPPPTVFLALYPAVCSSSYFSSLVFNVSHYVSFPHAIGGTALFLRSPSTSSYSGDDQTVGHRVDKSRRYPGSSSDIAPAVSDPDPSSAPFSQTDFSSLSSSAEPLLSESFSRGGGREEATEEDLASSPLSLSFFSLWSSSPSPSKERGKEPSEPQSRLLQFHREGNLEPPLPSQDGLRRGTNENDDGKNSPGSMSLSAEKNAERERSPLLSSFSSRRGSGRHADGATWGGQRRPHLAKEHSYVVEGEKIPKTMFFQKGRIEGGDHEEGENDTGVLDRLAPASLLNKNEVADLLVAKVHNTGAFIEGDKIERDDARELVEKGDQHISSLPHWEDGARGQRGEGQEILQSFVQEGEEKSEGGGEGGSAEEADDMVGSSEEEGAGQQSGEAEGEKKEQKEEDQEGKKEEEKKEESGDEEGKKEEGEKKSSEEGGGEESKDSGSSAGESEGEAAARESKEGEEGSKEGSQEEAPAGETSTAGGEGAEKEEKKEEGNSEGGEASSQSEEQAPPSEGTEEEKKEENPAEGGEEGGEEKKGEQAEGGEEKKEEPEPSASEEEAAPSPPSEESPEEKGEEKPSTAEESKGEEASSQPPPESEEEHGGEGEKKDEEATKAEETAGEKTEEEPKEEITEEEGKKEEEEERKKKETESKEVEVRPHVVPPEEKKKLEKEKEEEEKKQIAIEKNKEAERRRKEAVELLKEHRLGRGGPRGRSKIFTHSHMSAQDKLQHEQLEQAAEMATNLTQHLHRQHELKTREMFLKRKEIAHLNQLSRFQKLMQSAVAAVWKKMSGIKKTLKRLGSQSGAIGDRFLEETDHRVLRPEELPYAEISPPEKDQRLLTTTTEGIVMDCPTDCAPAACDNKPTTPVQCFKFEETPGGGGFRRCERFSDPNTATCRAGYTRCAMAAPVRGKHYQLFESTPAHPLPQPLLILGSNLHACLRLLPVHESTKCSPESSETIEKALKDTQAIARQPPPHVLEQAILFENIQVPSQGTYKLCMLQYWRPPHAKPTDDVYIMGIDDIGTLTVIPQPDEETLKHVAAMHQRQHPS